MGIWLARSSLSLSFVAEETPQEFGPKSQIQKSPEKSSSFSWESLPILWTLPKIVQTLQLNIS